MQEKMKLLGRVSVATIVIGAILLAIFRFANPGIRPDQLPMTFILIVAMILSAWLDHIWQKRKKQGDDHD